MVVGAAVGGVVIKDGWLQRAVVVLLGLLIFAYGVLVGAWLCGVVGGV